MKRHRKLQREWPDSSIDESAPSLPSRRPARFAALAILTTQFFALTASAQAIDPDSRLRALDLAITGDALFVAGDYTSALERFTRASKLVNAPTLMLRQAECLEKLGHFVEAAATYSKAASYPIDESATEPFRAAVDMAKTRLSVVQARLARLELVIQASDPDAVLVTLNDLPVSAPLRQTALELNPGLYRLMAVSGRQSVTETVTLEAGSSRQVILRLLPSPVEHAVPMGTVVRESRPANARRGPTVGWVSLGVGAAGVLTGLATGIEVLRLKHDLDKKDCKGTVCGPEARDEVRTYDSLRVVSTVGFVVGGVGLAVGSALFYFTPRAAGSARARLTPWISIGGAGLSGSF